MLGGHAKQSRAAADGDAARSFPPVADGNSEILILGTMPGRESLAAEQYYAHPRNLFWRVMSAALGFDVDLPYDARLTILRVAGIALWDVLHSCRRPGSLDARIERSSMVPNDFVSFYKTHRRIATVLFNGAKAEAAYRQHVAPELGITQIRYQRLPSTSPAHASQSFEGKLAAWKAGLRLRAHDRT